MKKRIYNQIDHRELYIYSIANNVSIGQGEHKTAAISTNSIFYANEYDELTEGECIIGHDVWVGTGAIILRGVTIGNGAIHRSKRGRYKRYTRF